MRVFQVKGLFRVLAVLVLLLALLISIMFSQWVAPARSGDMSVYGAEYSVGTEADLIARIASAPGGSVITVTANITLTKSLRWDDKNLTIKGSSPEITLSRSSAVGNSPMLVVGGLDTSQTTPAGLTLRDIAIDDKDNPGAHTYDGIICAYRQGVTIDLESGATLVNAGSGSSVYLSGTAPTGPVLNMREGSRVMDASIKGKDGAGVFAGPGSLFTMYGGLIQNNKTTVGGGGVYVADDSRFVMKSGLVQGNTSLAGGGVLVSGAGAGGVFIMEGGSITGNMVSGQDVTKNRQGWDVAVEAPAGSDPALAGVATGYTDAAFSARIYPGAIIGSGKVGVQNVTSTSYASAGKAFNQAVFVPDDMSASVCVGALNQYAGTAALDILTSSAAEALIVAKDPAAASGLTYAGNVMYAPPSNTGNIRLRLNYPDEIPTYDSNGMNIRNRYGYALLYVPLDSSGAVAGPVNVVIPARAEENIVVAFPAEPGASAYGVAKYYYDKSGSFDLNLSGSAGGSIVEKSGLSGALHFGGSAVAPLPFSFTLRTVPEPGWRIGAITLTAGDGYVISKEFNDSGEFTVYYTDLAMGVNKIEAAFVKADGSIDLSIDDALFVYDGDPHSAAVSGIIPGDEVRYMYRVGNSGFIASRGNPTFTDANGVIASGFAGGVNGEEIVVYATVTRGAVSERASATFTITPRPVTVKPVDLEKIYDGVPLTPYSVEISSGTLINGHGIDISSAVFTGSQTDAGTSASNVSGISVAGTNPNNYAISYAPGKLTVTGTPPVVADVPDTQPGDGKTPVKDGGEKASGGKKSDGGDDTGGGGAASPSTGVTDDSGDGDVDEEDIIGEEPEDGGEPPDDGDEDVGTGIEPGPTPTTVVEPGDEGAGIPWWSWWPLFVAILIAALVIWFLIVYRRKREKDDEDILDEDSRR
jgi:hypothetical protein